MRKLRLPEINAAFSSAVKRIGRSERTAFFAGCLVGVIVHAFVLTNKFINRDEVAGLFASRDRTTLGRFLLSYLRDLFSNYSLPLVNGLVTIVSFMLISAMIVRILRIKRPLSAVLISAAVVTFPTVSNFFSYLHTIDANTLGLLIGVFGAYCTDRWRWGFVPGGVLMALSLGVYQSNICFVGALLATRGLQILLIGESSDREVLITLIRYIAAFMIGAAIYWLISKASLALENAELTSYMGLSDAGPGSLDEFFKLAGKSYQRLFRFLFRDTSDLLNRGAALLHAGLLALSALVFLARLLLNKRTVFQSIFAVALFALLPVAYNSIHLFKPETVHFLMLHSIAFVYILPLMLLEWDCPHAPMAQAMLSAAAFIGIGLTCFLWSIYANQGYLLLKLKYENIYSLLNRVTDSVERSSDYARGQTVVFVGKPANGNYPPTKTEHLDSFYSGMGFGNDDDYSFVSDDKHIKYFLRYYIGVYFDFADDSLISSVSDDPRVGAMPCYPQTGSIQKIDGILVVKFGES